MAKYSDDIWRGFKDISRALADENRIKILIMLNVSPLCVCQIVHILNLAPSTVSKHLAILQAAGLISGHKKGKWIFYNVDEVSSPARGALKYVAASLRGSETVAKLERDVKAILKQDTDRICRRVYGDDKGTRESRE
jgi:DNA-binding transcriptional ArsR family regulator